jgi:hypothetical protein
VISESAGFHSTNRALALMGPVSGLDARFSGRMWSCQRDLSGFRTAFQFLIGGPIISICSPIAICALGLLSSLESKKKAKPERSEHADTRVSL